MKIAAIIAARYASTRFPGKPLANIAGKTMIQRVYEQCKQINELAYVIVATFAKLSTKINSLASSMLRVVISSM